MEKAISNRVVLYQMQLYCIKCKCIVSNAVVLYQMQLYCIRGSTVTGSFKNYYLMVKLTCKSILKVDILSFIQSDI